MNLPVKQEALGTGTMESVLARGDLSKLTEQQRTDYYLKLCHSLGLNPLTQPFEYLNLNGKLVLYAKRACADQLRKINGISLKVVSQTQMDGLLTVHVSAKDSTGREDEDLGVVNFPDTLKGEARANSILKAVTKAKRRVTLSISGLGFLDETEVEDIPAPAKQIATVAPITAIQVSDAHNPQTGEVIEAQAEQPINWIEFGRNIITTIKAQPKTADATLEKNKDRLEEMAKASPKAHRSVMAAYKKFADKHPTPADDPENYLAWLREECAKVMSVEALTELDMQEQEVLQGAFPPDQQAARGIFAARARELSDAGISNSEA